jgi:DNA-binding response OmpR family regulator
MVIESDHSIRALLVEWLETAGYRTRIPLRDGPIAPADVDLLLVDLVDLRSAGAASIDCWRAIYGDAQVIALSTQLDRNLDGSSRLARAIGADHVFSKPVNRADLLSAVSNSLERPR